jgi:hypothetical protein
MTQLIEQFEGVEIRRQEQTYERWKEGKKPFTELVYNVPEQRISPEKALEIARLAYNFKLGEIAVGREYLHPFAFCAEGTNLHLDPIHDYDILSTFEPGTRIEFYLRGASKLEFSTILALKELLQKS